MNVTRLSVLAAVAAVLAIAASAPAERERKVIVLEGDETAPGSRLFFGSFSYPVINESGDIAFRGSLDFLLSQGVNSNNNTGIWRTANGVLERIAREGTDAPGTLGGHFGEFESPHFNDAGHVAFFAELQIDSGTGVNPTNNEAIWAGPLGGLELVARIGRPAPGIMQNIFFKTLDATPYFTNSGEVAFTAFLDDMPDTIPFAQRQGVWRGTPGNLNVVARGGFLVRDMGGPVATGYGISSANDVGGSGLTAGLEVGVAGVTVDDDKVVLVGGPPSPFAREGEPTGVPFRNFKSFTSVTTNNAGDVAVHATFLTTFNGDPPREGIWAGTPGALQPLGFYGGPVPGIPGAQFSAFSGMAMNAAGEVAFIGTLRTGVGGVVIADNYTLCTGLPGATTVIARRGEQAAELPAGVEYGTFLQLMLNANGDIVFLTELQGAGVNADNRYALFFYDAAKDAIELIEREGTLIDLDPNILVSDLRTVKTLFMTSTFDRGSGGEDGLKSAINDSGQVAYLMVMTDAMGAQSTGLFISQTEINSCTGDLNINGEVESADLAILLAGWGLDGPTDFNNSGETDSSDLAVLLAAWGVCP